MFLFDIILVFERTDYMIQVKNVTLRFGKRTLFEDVSIQFTSGNCYGIIGANGAGKSTFLKILSGEIDTTSGEVIIGNNERISVLEQNHYAYEDFTVMNTVLMGNKRLYEIMQEKEELYSHTEFSDADGMRLAELEGEFMDMNGWEAESDAAVLLSNVGIDTSKHYMFMKDLEAKEKVKVLLAKSLFQNPDVLLLDEPTNNLDLECIEWLEEFIINYPNTVLVVSHDRHFLNKVCTHTVDIDYSKMKLYVGNYDFWYESSQLALRQKQEQNKKKEEKIKELQDFIARFSANASKSKQATSRKKMLEKIELEEIIPSSRKYPYIDFKPDRLAGNEILTVKNLTKTVDGKKILDKVSFTVLKGDKIAILGKDDMQKTMLFKILMGEERPDKGEFIFGKTIQKSYFPQDNSDYFQSDDSIMQWIGSFYDIKDETILRGFLGRMLFSGEDVFKKVSVLSGGEKARCMLSKCMLENPNFLILDEPTAHLDLESITSLNNGLIKFEGEALFASHDHQFLSTTANRIIEILSDGKIIDRKMGYDDYLENKEVNKIKEDAYSK